MIETYIPNPKYLIPREYQKDGIKFLWDHKRALLFDQPGMGKTLQAAMAAERPVLVACPTYLVEQWANFIKDQFPTHTVAYTLGGTQQQRLKDLNVNSGHSDWYIVNIEMLRTYQFPTVNTFIIDESHHVRNRNAQQSKAALEIALMTPRVYLLTGTPIYKEVDDLFFQLRIIAPRLFTSYYRFIEMYCRVEQNPWRNRIIGVHSTSSVRKMLSNFAIGRTYKDVGLELPKLVEHEIKLDMNANLMKAYKEIKEQYRLVKITFSNAGAVLQALRMATVCKEKLETVKSIVDDNRGYRAVVFCWYVDSAHSLGKVLNCPVITGEMSVTDRVRIAKSDNQIIVATIASLSEGVDLSAYKLVIFFEQDYTYGSMQQATARAVRHSTDNSPVQAYYLMMKKTVDELVFKMQFRRSATAEDIVGEALNG